MVAHQFDLGTTLSEHSLSKVERYSFSSGEGGYKELQKRLFDLLNRAKYSADGAEKKNLLRIALKGLGSPLWGDKPFLCFLFFD